MSCPIWIVLPLILCSTWECTESLGSPCSKCRSNCTAELFQWLTLTELWFHFCSCKSGICICLANCGCRLSWIDCGVFLSNRTSVVMKSCFTIFVKVTRSAELFGGIRNCLFRAKGFLSCRQWWRFSCFFTTTTTKKTLREVSWVSRASCTA